MGSEMCIRDSSKSGRDASQLAQGFSLHQQRLLKRLESGELLCHMIFAGGEWGNGRLESPDGAHCVYIGGSTGGLTRELVDKRQPPSFLDFITCMLASALVLAVARP